MGYRHQVVSNINPLYGLEMPQWFREKHESFIDFDEASYWFSRHEFKMHGPFKDLNTDIQKVLQETSGASPLPTEVQLVYFADEGEVDHPDIAHVTITAKKITTRMATDWVEQRHV